MITTIGFTTRDRPEALARCMRSYIDNARAHGRRPRVLVMDDAVPGLHRSARTVARTIGRDYPEFDVRYSGHEEKRAFIARLSRAGAPVRGLDFALLDPENSGYTLGANRNALQLATPGEHVLYVDDDSLCSLARPPEWEDRLVVAGPGSTQEYWYYPDHETALRAASFAPANLLDLHERYLGLSCRDIMEREGGIPPAEEAYWTAHMRGASTVKVTQNGVVGDCCMYSNIGHLLHARGGTVSRLRASAEGLATAMTSREIIRSPASPTLRLAGLLIGPIYGCDHSALLPPYMPVFRSSDSTFAATLSAVEPSCGFADIPWLVVHEPAAGRTYNTRGTLKPWHVSIGEVVRALLFVTTGGSAYSFNDPLGAKGTALVAFGGLPAAEFTPLLRNIVDEMIEMKIVRLRKMLDLAPGGPAYYADALNRSIALLQDSMRDERRYVPTELVPGRTAEQAIAMTQRLVRRFGELLQDWLAISRVAAEVRDADSGLVAPP